jgi:hypothetical protein
MIESEIKVTAGFERNTGAYGLSSVKVNIVKVYRSGTEINANDFNAPCILAHNNTDDVVTVVPVIFPNNTFQDDVDVIIPNLKNGLDYFFRYMQMGKMDTSQVGGSIAHSTIVPYGESAPPVIKENDSGYNPDKTFDLTFTFGTVNTIKPNAAIIIYAREPTDDELAGNEQEHTPLTLEQQTAKTILINDAIAGFGTEGFNYTHNITGLVGGAKYNFRVEAVTAYDAADKGTSSISSNHSASKQFTMLERPQDIISLTCVRQSYTDIHYDLTCNLYAKTNDEHYDIYQETASVYQVDVEVDDVNWNRGLTPIAQLSVDNALNDYVFYPTAENNIADVYADGVQGKNVRDGWQYTNGTTGKINWYLYGETELKKVSQLQNMYAVIDQQSTLTLTQAQNPFIIFYTKPDNLSPNAKTWHKSKFFFGSNAHSNIKGVKLLYTGDDPVGVHPEITGLNRIQLEFKQDLSTKSLDDGKDELIFTGSLQTTNTKLGQIVDEGAFSFTLQKFGVVWKIALVPDVESYRLTNRLTMAFGGLVRLVAIPYSRDNVMGTEKTSNVWLSAPVLAPSLNKYSVTIENTTVIDGVGSATICVTYKDSYKPHYTNLLLDLDMETNNGVSSTTASLLTYDSLGNKVAFVDDSNVTGYQTTARILVKVKSTAVKSTAIGTTSKWFADIVYIVKNKIIRGVWNTKLMALANNLSAEEKVHGIQLCDTNIISIPVPVMEKVLSPKTYVDNLTLTKINLTGEDLLCDLNVSFRIPASTDFTYDTFYPINAEVTLITPADDPTQNPSRTLSVKQLQPPLYNTNIVDSTHSVTFSNVLPKIFSVEVRLIFCYVNADNRAVPSVQKIGDALSASLNLMTPPSIMLFESEILADSTKYSVKLNNGGTPVTAITIMSIPSELAIDQNSITASPTAKIMFDTATRISIQGNVEEWNLTIPYPVLMFQGFSMDYMIAGTVNGYDNEQNSIIQQKKYLTFKSGGILNQLPFGTPIFEGYLLVNIKKTPNIIVGVYENNSTSNLLLSQNASVHMSSDNIFPITNEGVNFKSKTLMEKLLIPHASDINMYVLNGVIRLDYLYTGGITEVNPARYTLTIS